MDTHTWSKSAYRLIPSVAMLAALLGSRAANAQECKGNLQTGCTNERAVCQIEGKLARCTTTPNRPEGERECECVVPAEPPDAAFTMYPEGCSAAAEVTAPLKQVLGQLGISNPDVRVAPCQVSNSNSRLSVLIWGTGVPSGSPEDQARNATQLPAAITGDLFGVFMTDNFISGLAQSMFERKSSLRIVPGSPHIHLTGLALRFPGTNKVQSKIYGNDNQPTPTVDFTDTITDRLTSREGCSPLFNPRCGCTTSSKISASALQETEVVLLWPIFPASNGAAITAGTSPGLHAGVGCSVYQSLPDTISLPQTASSPPQKMKLVITYERVSEVEAGLAFHAQAPQLEPRKPAALINGSSSVTIAEGDSSSASIPYAVLATDFYGTPATPIMYTWSGDPGVEISAPLNQSTNISFSGIGMTAGTSMTRKITVQVKDSEGSYATYSLHVRIAMSSPHQPPHTR